MISISQHLTFEAAHQSEWLPTEHPGSRLHGHSYSVKISVRCERRLEQATFKAAMEQIVGLLDHRLLNDIEGLGDTSSEAIAEWIAKAVERWCPPEIFLVRVSVSRPSIGFTATYEA